MVFNKYSIAFKSQQQAQYFQGEQFEGGSFELLLALC